MMRPLCIVISLMAIILVASAASSPSTSSAAFPNVTYMVTRERAIITNGFIRVEFDALHPAIDWLAAEYVNGSLPVASLPLPVNHPNLVGRFANDNLFRHGVVLERESKDSSGNVLRFASSEAASPSMTVAIETGATPYRAVLVIKGIVDSVASPVLISEWRITVTAGEHWFTFASVTQVLTAATIIGARTSFYLATPAIYGLFNRGVEPMMNAIFPWFQATDTPVRVYSLGDQRGAVELNYQTSNTSAMLDFGVTMMCHNHSQLGKPVTAIQHTYGNTTLPIRDHWSPFGWDNGVPVSISNGARYSLNLTISLNNYDFPARLHSVAIANATAGSPPSASGRQGFDDLRVLLTSIYGSSVGALATYSTPFMLGTTVPNPIRAYTGLFNFFDPDNYFSISTMMYSGDPYLWNECRRLLETNLAKILPTGQLPHHFIVDAHHPTYVAISGATQTGPNLFWLLSALQYVKYSSNYQWLRVNLIAIESAMTFLTNMIDDKYALMRVPGSLYIDVFKRSNYTSDSNAAMVYLLREMADAEEFLGRYPQATQMRQQADDIADAINKYLWNGDDHYITQLNPDGTKRDFVDYDSNAMIIHWGIAPHDRAVATLARMDRGQCTHARATYVSEIYYGRDDCYGNNTGDSATAMARIGWSDAHAHIAIGDVHTYQYVLREPLVNDLFRHTWMTERYNCAGEAFRAYTYHEYPELLAMITHEIDYGINIGFNIIRIVPITRRHWTHNVGALRISHSPTQVICDQIPGDNGIRTVIIGALTPSITYYALATNIASGQQVRRTISSSSSGEITFAVNTGASWRLIVTSTPSSISP